MSAPGNWISGIFYESNLMEARFLLKNDVTLSLDCTTVDTLQ